MNEDPQHINRAIDVWALGCLIAEVITFMRGGVDGVKEFERRRLTPGRLPRWQDASFYQPNGDVKREVLDWMEVLKRDSAQPDMIPLLIDVSLQALQTDPRSRPDMDTIYQCLAVLSLRKQFLSVQELICEIHGAEEISAPSAQRRLASLRFVQERFEAWGHALLLDKDVVADCVVELSDSFATLIAKLLRTLRERV